VRRDDLVTFHVDGTLGSAVAGLTDCRIQPRAATPKPVWNPDVPQTIDFYDTWQLVPANRVYDNAFKVEWELFLRHVVDGGSFQWNPLEGAKGVQLAEFGSQSWRERRFVDVPALATTSTAHGHDRNSRRPTARSLISRRAPPSWPAPSGPPHWNRIAFAAAHVVADPRAAVDPWLEAAIDWDTTLAFRRHLWSHGFGVAEAMDTAQRGMGLDWPASLELIRRSVHEARSIRGAVVFSGAGTDHLPPGEMHARASDCRLRRAMRRRSNAWMADHPDGEPRACCLCTFTRRLRAGLRTRAVAGAHAGHPALAGRDVRSGARRLRVGAGGLASDPDHARAADVCASVINANAAKVDGVKVSLLDAGKEIALRARLPSGVRMYTGDDFNFAALIGGDASGYSDALLGIFDAIAPAASAALTALAAGDRGRFDAIRADGTAVAPRFRGADALLQDRRCFSRGSTAIQTPLTMVGGQQSARSLLHLSGIVPAGGCRRVAPRTGLAVAQDAGVFPCQWQRRMMALNP
jgi:hypothetical protein